MRTPPSWIPKAFGAVALLTGAFAIVEPDTRLARYMFAATGALNSAAFMWVRQDNVSSEQVCKTGGGGGGGGAGGGAHP